MSLEDPTFTDLTLGRALREQPLASLIITDPFLPSKHASNSSSIKLAILLVQNQQLEKKMASEPAKVNPHTQCYRRQRYGHLASQCPGPIKTLLVKVLIEDEKRMV